MPIAGGGAARTRGPARRAAAPARTAGTAGPTHVLDVPHALRDAAVHWGARWSPDLSAFVFEGAVLPEALRPFEAHRYSLEGMRQDALAGAPPRVARGTGGVTLRPHQVEGARFVADGVASPRRAALLADEVGLGKTYAVVEAILASYDVDTVLVVCPLYAVSHWRDSIAALGDLGKRFVVINYDRLRRLFDLSPARSGSRRPKRLKSLARVGRATAFDLVVWDECQRLRNPDSARSGFAAKLTAAAGASVWVTATAGSDPVDLRYLAPLLSTGRADLERAREDYPAWCAARGLHVTRGPFGRLVWGGRRRDDMDEDQAAEADRVRAADLATMRSLMYGGERPLALRRTPSDIAGWPEVQRVLVPVALEPEDAVQYRLAWGDFRAALELPGRGRDPRHRLAVQTRFLQKSSLLRTAATVDLARDLLAEGFQVAISVAFRETLAVFAEALAAEGHVVATLHGGRTPAENEASRLDFQHGRATVVCYTPTDAISLHQGQHNDVPRCNVIHDLRWSALQLHQIEGRCHRDGAFSKAFWLMGEGTVEERVARLVADRLSSMSVIHGEDAVAREIEAMIDAVVDGGPEGAAPRAAPARPHGSIGTVQ